MNKEKIVDFTFCKKCAHWKKSEEEEPCATCLTDSTNVDSIRPTHFEEINRKVVKHE